MLFQPIYEPLNKGIAITLSLGLMGMHLDRPAESLNQAVISSDNSFSTQQALAPRPLESGGGLLAALKVMRADDVMAGAGPKTDFRWQHDEFHEKGKFQEGIEQTVRRLKAAKISVPIIEEFSKPGRPWYDLHAAICDAYAKGLAYEDENNYRRLILDYNLTHVRMRLEPNNIVVLRHPQFRRNHVSRSGQVFASSEKMEWHELTEFRRVARWFVQNAGSLLENTSRVPLTRGYV